jgi:hypothetical protein
LSVAGGRERGLIPVSVFCLKRLMPTALPFLKLAAVIFFGLNLPFFVFTLFHSFVINSVSAVEYLLLDILEATIASLKYPVYSS